MLGKFGNLDTWEIGKFGYLGIGVFGHQVIGRH